MRPWPGAEGLLGAVKCALLDEEWKKLEGELSGEELERAMHSLKTGVVSGGDGLPIKWYKAFWPLIGEDVLGMYREAIQEGMLPGSAHMGHITLIHKKGKRADLTNFRLITLLCTD